MPTEANSPEESIPVDPSIVAEVVRHAERMADLTAVELERMGYRTASFPAWAYEELGALVQLSLWEQQGILAYLGDKVPSYNAARAELSSRLIRSATEHPQNHEPRAELSKLVFHVWMTSICWDASSETGCDFAAIGWNDEQFVAALAQILWDLRDPISNNPRLEGARE